MSNPQFSVVTLLSCTTSVAILLGIVRWLDLPIRQVVPTLSFIAAYGGMSMVCFVTAFRMPPALALLVAGAICTPTGFLVTLTRFTIAEGEHVAAMTTVMGAGILTGGLMLRAAGFRFERAVHRDLDSRPRE